ncbi:hypothetical protein K1719_046237 [Acacia pycnantha]|nr:hypothetical protein K1719_046237 [Acacia pycnantha]
MNGISAITSNALLQLTNETRPRYQTVNCDGMAFVISPTKAIPDPLVGQQEERFSSSTGAVTSFHYVLGWSFRVNGVAQNLDTSELPKLPRLGGNKQSMILLIGVPLMSLGMLFLVILSIVYYINWKKKFSEIVEEWEQDYGPQRIKYKDLYIATKGFKEKELLGSGGFGSVYKGTMPGSKIEVAVKKVSHGSQQGMREFIAEIVSIGRLRHRNLVSLLGYCRRKGELFLVYDFMSNGSLDKYLFKKPRVTLNWMQRFRIIKGVASGLCYLHEEWEQVVVHRDIKASNVLLDSELNGRLGDFGLARLYDHGTDPATTHVVGTLGYLAPEYTTTGRATTKSDVFAFGAFMLEWEKDYGPQRFKYKDLYNATKGFRDRELLGRGGFGKVYKGTMPGSKDEVVVKKVSHESRHEGIHCRNYSELNGRLGDFGVARLYDHGSDPATTHVVGTLGYLAPKNTRTRTATTKSDVFAFGAFMLEDWRPSMRLVVQYLNMEVPLPDFSTLISSPSCSGLVFGRHQNLDDIAMSLPSSSMDGFHSRYSIPESILSGGR